MPMSYVCFELIFSFHINLVMGGFPLVCLLPFQTTFTVDILGFLVICCVICYQFPAYSIPLLLDSSSHRFAFFKGTSENLICHPQDRHIRGA